MRKLILAMGLMGWLNATAWAVPQVLNFQGRLVESGLPVSGSRSMLFKIYDAPSGGVQLFSESRTVNVSTGIFNVLIGEATVGGIPLPVFDGGDRYIEVQVGAQVLPRQRVVSVAHAYVAAVARSLAAGATVQFQAIETASITANSVTAATGRFTEGVIAGQGTIYVDGNGTLNQGLANAVTITQKAGQNPARIRTAADGSQHLPADTGALDLLINAGATGNLFLNPFTSGNILLAKSTVTNTGAFILAPNASLTMSGAGGVITTGSSVNASGFFGASVDAAGAAFGTGANKSLFDATGRLAFPSAYVPALPQEAATKAYVDSQSTWTRTGNVVALTDPADNVVVQSTLTVQGAEFSVGASLLKVVGGNVGINNTNPTVTLDVIGTARVTGFSLPTGAAAGSVLTSLDAAGNAAWQPAAAGGGGGLPTNFQVFDANGTFVVPAGVTRVMVEVWGGGGGGGASSQTGAGGGGGGGGGGYGRQILTVIPGASHSVTIGAGGGSGGAGGTTSFGALMSASGGTGGASAGSTGGGAAGGTGGTSAAALNVAGGSGGGSGNGDTQATAAGGMGGAAPNGGPGGGGGRGHFSSGSPGRTGSVPGGGGGGAGGWSFAQGGAGASGRVVVTW